MLLTGSQHVHTFLGGNDPRQSCSTMLKLYWSHNRTQAYLGMDHYFQLFFLGGGGWEHGTLGGRGGNTHHAFTISSLWGWPFSLIFWRVRTFSFTFIFFKTCPPPHTNNYDNMVPFSSSHGPYRTLHLSIGIYGWLYCCPNTGALK